MRSTGWLDTVDFRLAESIHPSHECALQVVILSWNGREDTLRCLRSLVPQLDTVDSIIVVDNASHDGTVEAVATQFPAVTIVRNESNLGFAGGNNPGLARAMEAAAGWVWILNNDTFVPDGQVAALRRALGDQDASVGVVQPLLVRLSDPSMVDSAGHVLLRAPGVRDALAGRPRHDAVSQEIAGACAAAAVVRTAVLRDVGGFDEQLFVLFEDVDLMLRVRAAGWRVVLQADVEIQHARGVSGEARSHARRFWAQRNMVALAVRWWPSGALLRASPVLVWRVGAAIYFGLRSGAGRCLPLWWAALRSRRRSRIGLRAHGGDRWFGLDPFDR